MEKWAYIIYLIQPDSMIVYLIQPDSELMKVLQGLRLPRGENMEETDWFFREDNIDLDNKKKTIK